MIDSHELSAVSGQGSSDSFEDETYLAIYAQVIRDAIVAAVDWMPATCEIPLGGGPSLFEQIVHCHLKGADRKMASEFLLNTLAVIETSSPSDWFDYVNELGGSKERIAVTLVNSSTVH